MRQNYIFKASKLDEFHGQIVFFFEAIYYQSLTPFSDWDDHFIHFKLKPIYSRCKKLRVLMENVHLEYLTISNAEKKIIYDSSINSTEIEAICNTSLNIVNKKDLTVDIGRTIHNLYQYIYYDLPQNKCFIDVYGSMKTHYESLKTENRKIKKCPFCGLQNIHPLNNKTKQTYDHYIPLSLYPFVGIQSKNLVPTCKDCNEDFKHDKDSLFLNPRRTIRRKLFYPYGNYNHNINIELKNIILNHSNLKIENCDIDIICNQPRLKSEMQSWKDIYEVNTRYKNAIEDDSDEWYKEFFDYFISKQTDGTYIDMQRTYNEYRTALSVAESTTNSFLKGPYFESVNSLTTVFK